MPRRFYYILDPVCLICIALYALQRFVIRPSHWGQIAFIHDHLNDLLCIPIFLPMALGIHRLAGTRSHDQLPKAWEILAHLALWSIYFEGIAPLLTNVYRTTADPLDVAAYTAGALIAGLAWGSWRRGRPRV